jgi:hypothetical protein
MATNDRQTIERLKAERDDRRVELFAALLLSIAAFASSWAGFQAALWDGEQAQHYARGQEFKSSADSAAVRENQAAALDLILFTGWLDAFARNETKLQDFYRARFRPQFATAFDGWRAARTRDAATARGSPFQMPAYVAQMHRSAASLQKQAGYHFAEGNRSNAISDAFVQATVIFALSLFLSGIIQSFSEHRVRLAMLAIGAICLALGIARIVVLPALSLDYMVTG